MEKSQQMRLVDIYVLGPFMVWYAVTSHTMPYWARIVLGVSGVTTVTYNLQNYLLRSGGN